jgi:hypothetical protein
MLARYGGAEMTTERATDAIAALRAGADPAHRVVVGALAEVAA